MDEPKLNGLTATAVAANQGKLKMLQRLLASNADLNKTSPAGTGPLYLAIKSRKPRCAALLIEKGAKVYLDDHIKRDFSPIFAAVMTAQVSILEKVADLGVPLDEMKDSAGYTPLTLAVKLGIHEVVNYLSLRGCDLNQIDPR